MNRLLKLLPFVLVLALLAGGGTYLLAGRSSPYTVKVYLANAQRLVPGNNVDVDGVPVGQVSAVQLAPDNEAAGAIVTISVNGRYAPLREGTHAVARPDGVIGDMFLELTSVQGGPAIPSGGSIPLENTQTTVTLDQLTNVLNANTRQELQTLVQQGGVALRGRGQDINKVLARLPQISSDLAGTTGTLDQQTQQLSDLDAEFSRVAAMISGEHSGLEGDINNGASILDTLAAHQGSLQQELIQANSSLGQANNAIAGRQQDLHQLLQQLPALLRVLQSFESHGTKAASVINPCMQNLLSMLSELANADRYRQPAGASDGTGSMLRIDPQLVGPGAGSFNPQASCSGGGG
jgi:phospholipid/cholesterol/gamma-HCH transport system substrate-binding protein